jgi:preprotein translocase subunit Sec63
MSDAASGSGITALMDAYAVLGVEHSATPEVIRRAYKQRAREHHPDRQAGGSAQQERATAKMAEINAAYQLAREAPLRFHRVSTGARPDEPWTEEELDEAVRRARNENLVASVFTYVLVAFVVIVPPWVLLGSQGGGTAVFFLMIPFWILAWSLVARRRGALLFWRLLDVYTLFR